MMPDGKRHGHALQTLLPFLIVVLLVTFQPGGPGAGASPLSGRQIMDEAFMRHAAFPYVYEEQTMVLTDKDGNREVRKARYYGRIEPGSGVKQLIVFDYPREIQGVALRIVRYKNGLSDSGIYLPAYEREIRPGGSHRKGDAFPGMDFSPEDLAGDAPGSQYIRKPDEKIARFDCFVVEALPDDAKPEGRPGHNKRRHFIRKDIFFVLRTDYYNCRGQHVKRLSRHDLTQVEARRWRANMILTEDLLLHHTTLIKTDRRIFSGTYVPSEIFTSRWLKENRHIKGAGESVK